MFKLKKIYTLLLSSPVFLAHAETYIARIPPINEGHNNQYLMTLVENDASLPSPYQITVRNGNFYIPFELLSILHIPNEGVNNHEGLVDLTTIPDVTTCYNLKKNKLFLTVPTSWLPKQKVVIDDTWTSSFYNDDVTPGLTLNYNLYAEKSNYANYTSGWLNGLYYNHFGYLSLSGKYTNSRFEGINYSHFQRLNTTFVINNRRNAENLLLGDVQTDIGSGYGGVYMGGIQFRRDFSLRPDIITYPTIKLMGTAATPTTMDFFVNGSRLNSSKVNPGPYVINNIPFINGDGTMTVVTTDQNGRQVASIIPFDIQQDMLKPGLSDFNASFGLLRYNFGSYDDEYKHFALSGTYRYGLTNSLTVLSHTEAANGMALIGEGLQYNMHDWGRIDADFDASQAYRSNCGLNVYFSYSKQFQTGTITASHLQSSPSFSNLSNYDTSFLTPTASDQLFYSLWLPYNLGSLGAGVVYMRNSGVNDALANLSFSHTFMKLATLSLSDSLDLSNDNNNTVMLSISLPLTQSLTASVQGKYNEYNQHEFDSIVSLDHQSVNNQGLNWNINTSINNNFHSQGYSDANLDWNTSHATYRAGVYGYTSAYTPWIGVQGSLVYMNHSLFLSRQLGDAFVKVDTGGIEGVPYYYGGSLVGKTDAEGVGFINNVIPYEHDSVSIDPTHLNGQLVATKIRKSFFVPRHAGYSVHFMFNNLANQQMIRLAIAPSLSLIPGETIVDEYGNKIAVLAYGNMALLQNIPKTIHYSVVNQGKSICHFNLSTHHINGVEVASCQS